MPTETGIPGVSIVIPAWNEERRLGWTLERYLPALEKIGGPFEVIVVIDGSTDGTASVASRFADRGVRVLEFPRKLGKGGAVITGFRAARYEYVGFLDADGPIPPDEIRPLVELLRDCDCVVSSRWMRGSNVVVPEPVANRVASRLWNYLVRSLLLLPLYDTQCGAKFYKRSMVLTTLKAVSLTNMAFDISLLYHIKEAGGVIREVPVTWTHNPFSKFGLRQMIYVMFLSLVAVRVMNLPMSSAIPRGWTSWFSKTLNSS